MIDEGFDFCTESPHYTFVTVHWLYGFRRVYEAMLEEKKSKPKLISSVPAYKFQY